jgi:phosphate-selective porin OprO/OprP
MSLRSVPCVLAASLALGVSAPSASAEDQALLDRLRAVEDELSLVRRQLEVKQEEDANKASASALVTADRSGFQIQSQDKRTFRLRLRGYLQSDTRLFTDGGTAAANPDTFLIRRARPIFEGTLFELVDFRLMPDFAGSSVSLQDAYVNLRLRPEAQIQSGKFKSPFGLERLQSATAMTFVERALPTSLVPNRDIGLMFQGEWDQGLLQYQLAALNGVNDGSSGVTDVNDAKDVVLRVFSHPFQDTTWAPLQGLGVGFAASVGNQDETSTPRYVTPGGQEVFFRYGSNVVQNGTRYRLSPQAYYYWGPFGAMFEWVRSSAEFELGNDDLTADVDAWQIAASYVLTGENASYRGVVPRSLFETDGSGWGAFELAARYSQLEVPDDVFDEGFASASTSAREAREWAIGINWYLNPALKLSLNYDQTHFDGGAADGADRETEGAILSMFQVQY